MDRPLSSGYRVYPDPIQAEPCVKNREIRGIPFVTIKVEQVNTDVLDNDTNLTRIDISQGSVGYIQGSVSLAIVNIDRVRHVTSLRSLR